MRYAQPGDAGGRLIRSLISLLKKQGIKLPITSHILIAVSAGADSIALAQLLTKYGRRVGAKTQFKIVHINHRWRGKESDLDAKRVEEFASKTGVPFILEVLSPPSSADRGESWENLARSQRKAIYQKLAREHNAVVFTAHHGDDLAETVLWRILTGASETHLAGIRFQDGPEIRPFLGVRKKLIYPFLREENLSWSEDATNHADRFLRARMRTLLMPAIEKLFPKAVEHLMEMGLNSQETKNPNYLKLPEKVRLKKIHYQTLEEKQKQPHWEGELSLPKGWKLVKTRDSRK